MGADVNARIVAGGAGMAWPHLWRLSVDRLRRRRFRLVENAGSAAGFTLVEVIVALAILSVGLSVLLGSISASLRQGASAARMAEASTLAQSLMAEVGTDQPLEVEDRVGEFPNGYRWHLKMQPYGSAKEREEWPVGAYVISTEVEWEEGTGRRSYALTTLRLGPKAERQ
jgi:general secretion pathway protein I